MLIGIVSSFLGCFLAIIAFLGIGLIIYNNKAKIRRYLKRKEYKK